MFFYLLIISIFMVIGLGVVYLECRTETCETNFLINFGYGLTVPFTWPIILFELWDNMFIGGIVSIVQGCLIGALIGVISGNLRKNKKNMKKRGKKR